MEVHVHARRGLPEAFSCKEVGVEEPETAFRPDFPFERKGQLAPHVPLAITPLVRTTLRRMNARSITYLEGPACPFRG